LRKDGYDGYIDWDSEGEAGVREFVAFRSEQVKSATGNRGTFDGSNPDITYQLRSVDEERAQSLDEEMQTQDTEGLSAEERAQLLEHQRFLLGEPVAQLTGEEFAKAETPLTERVPQWYAEKGFSEVPVEGIGTVLLDKTAVRNTISHGLSRTKSAAFAAVPEVLQKGRIVFVEPLKGGGIGKLHHVAAPVKIADETYVMDVLVKDDANTKRMYVHEVFIRNRLQEPAFKTGAVAAGAAGKRARAGDGAVASVLKRIFSVKEDEADVSSSPSPSYQLRPVNRGAGGEKAASSAPARSVAKQQKFEASGVPQSLLQEIDARLERIRARQIGQEDLSRAAQPVAVATREADLATRGVRKALDRLAEPIARRMEKINPVLGQTLRRLEFDMGRGRVAAWEKVKPFADGLAQMARVAPNDYAALDLALKNGERSARDLILTKHELADAWSPVELLLRTYHAKLGQAGFEVGFLENYFPRKVVDAEGLLDFYAGDEAAVEAINEATQSKEDAGKFFSGLFGIPQNLKERTIWRVTPQTSRFYASPMEALQTYIEQVNEALALKAFFGEAAVFTGKVKSGGKADAAELGGLFGMDIGGSITKHVERLVERGVVSGEQGLEVSQMLRARFNKAAQWKALQGLKNLTLLTTLGHFTTTLTQVGDLAFSLYEAGVYHTLAEAHAALKSESKVTKEAVGIDAVAEGFKDPSFLYKAVDWVFKWTGFNHMDRVGKEAIMNAKLAALREDF